MFTIEKNHSSHIATNNLPNKTTGFDEDRTNCNINVLFVRFTGRTTFLMLAERLLPLLAKSLLDLLIRKKARLNHVVQNAPGTTVRKKGVVHRIEPGRRL